MSEMSGPSPAVSAAAPLVIESHRGPYQVTFAADVFSEMRANVSEQLHFIIDERVARLYESDLKEILASPKVLLIEATEENKSLDKFSAYVEALAGQGIRRGHELVAVGGGIIQDITCFLAATLLRGLEWRFYPTTLLAQADSCIGSKSSINVGKIKNVLGTFTPPRAISISTRLLETLDERDVRSGIGEMLKVHVIDGPQAFDQIAQDYSRLTREPEVLQHYIRRSLEIKKTIIEQDEFDRSIRNIMNYGHSFGHAIESATNFGIPHGIAVTIGMDMANYVAVKFDRMAQDHYSRMHPALAANYAGFEKVEVPFEPFMQALSKDKKNAGKQLGLILPDAEARGRG